MLTQLTTYSQNGILTLHPLTTRPQGCLKWQSVTWTCLTIFHLVSSILGVHKLFHRLPAIANPQTRLDNKCVFTSQLLRSIFPPYNTHFNKLGTKHKESRTCLVRGAFRYNRILENPTTFYYGILCIVQCIVQEKTVIKINIYIFLCIFLIIFPPNVPLFKNP